MDVEAFEQACGVGVVITPEEIENAVSFCVCIYMAVLRLLLVPLCALDIVNHHCVLCLCVYIYMFVSVCACVSNYVCNVFACKHVCVWLLITFI